MKKILIATCFSFISSGFCLDEYLSIEKGKIEVDMGYEYSNVTRLVNEDGKKKDVPGGLSPSTNFIPLQVKFGVIDGLDLELSTKGTISNKDAGTFNFLNKKLAGFSQPQLAAKYTFADFHAGAYLNLVLPFVTGNLDHPEPSLGLGMGAVYANRFGDFRLTGTSGYQINFENKDKFKTGNVFSVYAKPEAMWTEYIGTYFGLKYSMASNKMLDGNSINNTDYYVITLVPGVNAQLLKWLAYEVNVPFDVMGKNGPATWGIMGQIYATLP